MRGKITLSWVILLVVSLLAIVLFIRLGIWQLDRLEQRRIFNIRVMVQLNQPPLTVNADNTGDDFYEMEFRQVVASGEYDFSQEIAIVNQADQNQPGVHLVTPLRIPGSPAAILVDRGWIPDEDYRSKNWMKYSEPGNVTVQGVLRRTQTKPDFGSRIDPTPVPGGERKEAWFFVNVSGIQQQVDYPIVPGVYIQQAPLADVAEDQLPEFQPVRSRPDIEITEGPHQGYAIQWFIFAFIVLVGFPILTIRQWKKEKIALEGKE